MQSRVNTLRTPEGREADNEGINTPKGPSELQAGAKSGEARGVKEGKASVRGTIHYNLIRRAPDFEYLLLIIITLFGMMILISSKDLLIFYLAIEVISLSFYIIAVMKPAGQTTKSGGKNGERFTTEAGLKYFLLGAVSSGFLLFGCALVYLSTGLTNIEEISLACISD